MLATLEVWIDSEWSCIIKEYSFPLTYFFVFVFLFSIVLKKLWCFHVRDFHFFCSLPNNNTSGSWNINMLPSSFDTNQILSGQFSFLSGHTRGLCRFSVVTSNNWNWFCRRKRKKKNIVKLECLVQFLNYSF